MIKGESVKLREQLVNKMGGLMIDDGHAADKKNLDYDKTYNKEDKGQGEYLNDKKRGGGRK